ncbi:TniQ family protein [Lignipirellula cremea]|uniref:TniQ family protein n=1 Tax=Lignipirellula cremea TaxID=2528010 RepID=UPI0018D22E29|nr:TniQ family protein [Lignipirellula cremea]
MPGESLASLVRRHAVAMGYERIGRIRSLAADCDKAPTHLDHLAPGPLLDRFADLFAVSPEKLSAMTVHPYADHLLFAPRGSPPANLLDSKTILRFFRSAAPSVCPRCLASEVTYERLLWSFRPLPICLDHDCHLITRCPQCHKTMVRGRIDVERCRCSFSLTSHPADILSSKARTIAEQVRQWLCKQGTPLEFSAPALFWWLERLASAVSKTPPWLADARVRLEILSEIDDDSLVWFAAAEILSEWPQRFEQFLDIFQTVAKHRSTDTGINRAFGSLLREAAHLEELGFPSPADVLRGYLLEHYSRGHLNSKVCLFHSTKQQRVVRDRPWLTRTQAAKQLGLRHASIADLLNRGLLAGEVRSAGQNGRSVGLISRESVSALQRQLQSSVTVKQTASRLGIGRSRIFELIRDELLPRAVRTSAGWLIPNDAIEPWEQLLRSLPILSQPDAAWLTIRDATRNYGPNGLCLTRLLQQFRSGKIRGGRVSGADNYQGLLVLRSDTASTCSALQSQQSDQRGWSLHRLAKELIPGRPIKESVLKKWIAAGLLHAGRNRRTWRITPTEIERFRQNYCLAQEACELLGISRKTLSRWETTGKITAAYSRRNTQYAGASLFRRKVLEDLLTAPSSRNSKT